MTARHRYRPRSSTIFAELGDGSGVILDLESKAYFTLNTTGVFVWKQITERPLDGDELAGELSKSYEIDLVQARIDVEILLRQLDGQSLVERS